VKHSSSRPHGLGDFAPQSSVTVEEKNCAPLASRLSATLDARRRAANRPSRAENTYGIESGMLEETPVFHRKHGFGSSLGMSLKFMARRFSREFVDKLLSEALAPARRLDGAPVSIR